MRLKQLNRILNQHKESFKMSSNMSITDEKFFSDAALWRNEKNYYISLVNGPDMKIFQKNYLLTIPNNVTKNHEFLRYHASDFLKTLVERLLKIFQ